MATVKVTLIKSMTGRIPNHKLCVKGLGLRRIGHTVVSLVDHPAILGSILDFYSVTDAKSIVRAVVSVVVWVRPVAVATKVKAPAPVALSLQALKAANSRCIVACRNSVSFP